MTQARAGLSVRKLTADEVRGRGGTVAPPKAKLDFAEAEPEAYGDGAYGTVGHTGVVHAPERAYLAVDTVGSPRTSEDFRVAAEALYAAAYGVKVRNKALYRRGTPGADDAARSDFRMPPLERLRGDVAPQDTDSARWTLLLRRPAWIDEAEVGDVLEQLEVSKGLSLARVHCLDLPASSYLQTRVDGRWSAALTPTAKAFAVQLRERGLTAVDGAWHEVCLGEPGAPVGENSYLLRLRLA
ncbi:hypothetical protein LB823_15220 [Tsukamurella sp. M9C]|uniref:hypothetical protein n=1 Tax=Tsukamurella sp. M9C TaxID=2877520 RepID=UPI001CCB78AB|nr:hypothetical protein [Tsukamurella sp. M9C]MCA0157543.1 hypothetical protein [Tsukamurella sp. M9C]